MFNRNFWNDAANRAIRTMAQSALALLSTSTFISEIDVQAVFSATLLSGILSILTSISAGVPETVEVLELEKTSH